MPVRRRPIEQVPYPTDERGFAIPLEELGFSRVERRGPRRPDENEHHIYYYARMFGRFAISRTFRSLEDEVARMSVSQHNTLHALYSGIDLPPFSNMLDRIEQAKADGERLMIRGKGGYQFREITDERMQRLYREYNTL